MKNIFILTILLLFVLGFHSRAQLVGSRTYDFRDGIIISQGKSDDGSLTLSGGSFKLHGATYGLNMKVNGEINIAVQGSSTVRFLGSKHSGLNMVGTVKSQGDLGTQNTKVVNDLADTYDFVYAGSAATLNFKTVSGTGNDLYLPSVEVIPAQAGATATAALSNIVYFFDLRDGSIIPNETSLNGNYTIEKGLFKIESGPSNAYGFNGSTHGSILKTGNKITLNVAGNSKIRIGGCQYSNGTISISGVNGRFDKNSQSSKTATCYHQDGATVDFLYVGTAGPVVLEFTGTTYIPCIEVAPIPYAVELDPWVKKSGTISLNGSTITFTAGNSNTDNPTVTVSDGTVISVTPELALLRMNLGGKALSSYTPSVSGDIASVSVRGDTLKVVFADAGTKPNAYSIIINDNSQTTEAEAGKTYTYSFADATVLPQVSYSSLRYPVFYSQDGILTMKSNSDDQKKQLGYHDAQHGAVFFPGNSIEMKVAGNATITFGTCQYGSATDAVFEFKNAEGQVLGSTGAHNIGTGACGTNNFSYSGQKGTITAILKSASFPTAEVYIHGLTIENAAKIETSAGKTEVWDFGATQLDSALYKNNLNVEAINAWYAASVTKGSSGNVLPSFTAGVLSFIAGGNDRLRTTNTSLTRYDENTAGATDYSGRIYVNSAAATGRYLSLTLSEDDEVTLVTRTDAGGTINFKYVPNPAAQTDQANVSELVSLKFVAKEAGTYHIFDNKGKPSYYRVYRKDATYAHLSGTVDISGAAGIPENFAIVFRNEAGKTWKAAMANNGYSAKLPAGYSYTLSLADANGFIITSETQIEVSESTSNFNVVVRKVELFTVSGSIVGIDPKLSSLVLTYTPDAAANKVFKPVPVINAEAKTYTVQLEPDCQYTLSAAGVNDFFIPNNTIIIGKSDQSANVVFEAKTVYPVSIQASGLNQEQLGKLSLNFTNLNEKGYSYPFASVSGIALRDGTYSIEVGGLNDYPVELGLVSNLTVAGAPVMKTLAFKPVTVWSFDDQVIANGTPSYKGMKFTGTISNEIAKGHLAAKAGATIQVPVKPGDKMRVTYYYSADFSIEGGAAITTASNSTSTFEYADYTYTGSNPGYVTITIGSGAGTTYLTEISIGETVNFKDVIHVGADKTYKSVNEALAAVAKMIRNNNERVIIMIDPGNYEEMLVINLPNITLKNAASKPGIGLLNKGVDIEPGAVRITAYYGHGYNYYSMGNNQKWNADILRVNKENGYLSYENKGSGTTNGSYWNATVVVTANGFEAENIIFENSFNQYISKKESEDVVVEWASGGKGTRPTDYGNTNVQKRSFVERAAAIATVSDKIVLKNCRVVGRQDSFYGGTGRVVVYKGAVMGAVDYLFGPMTAVFYKTELVMNVSDDSNDASYLTAAQQSSGRGYLMYECTVKSAEPGTQSASAYLAKPGYFGRPWQATTSEVVFFKTTVEKTNFPGSEGKSMIAPIGWNSSLGGESRKMYEYGTIEKSGENNSASRASWSTVLTAPTLSDGAEITTFNFTKGSDNWDPIPALVAGDTGSSAFRLPETSQVKVYAFGNQIYFSNIRSKTKAEILNANGQLVQVLEMDADQSLLLSKGLWIVRTSAADGQKTVKVVTR